VDEFNTYIKPKIEDDAAIAISEDLFSHLSCFGGLQTKRDLTVQVKVLPTSNQAQIDFGCKTESSQNGQ
jgi:hypothetical protein